MEYIETITSDGKPLAIIIRSQGNPEKTNFITPAAFNFQLGFVVYPTGGEIARHTHRPIQRTIAGTSEVLIVREGRCEIDIYDDERELVTTLELQIGDIMLMISGGHGFRMLEDTVFLEIKQGPYPGVDEKERF